MPNKPIEYLTVDEAIEIHQQVIEYFGGPGGIRDPGLLESALFRPQTGYYNDIYETAAALFESLIINHPFIDGNKRVAFFATDVFLRLNGFRFDVNADAAHARLIGFLDTNTCDYDHLLPWIRQSVLRI